jgi:hypothetical protein
VWSRSCSYRRRADVQEKKDTTHSCFGYLMGARFYGFTFQMFYFQRRGTLHFVNMYAYIWQNLVAFEYLPHLGNDNIAFTGYLSVSHRHSVSATLDEEIMHTYFRIKSRAASSRLFYTRPKNKWTVILVRFVEWPSTWIVGKQLQLSGKQWQVYPTENICH